VSWYLDNAVLVTAVLAVQLLPMLASLTRIGLEPHEWPQHLGILDDILDGLTRQQPGIPAPPASTKRFTQRNHPRCTHLGIGKIEHA
jgi:hypothetical protein